MVNPVNPIIVQLMVGNRIGCQRIGKGACLPWLTSRVRHRKFPGFHGLPSLGFNSVPEEYQLLLQAGSRRAVAGLVGGGWLWLVLFGWFWRVSRRSV